MNEITVPMILPFLSLFALAAISWGTLDLSRNPNGPGWRCRLVGDAFLMAWLALSAAPGYVYVMIIQVLMILADLNGMFNPSEEKK